MFKRYSVYCHTNKINGKRYIGITSKQPERRWRNGIGYKNNKHFYFAIRKYGWDNFLHEVWYTNISFEDACRIERELISKYNSACPDYGYNVDLGGNGQESVSEYHKLKISEARKGKPHPHKGRSLYGDKSPTYGTHRDEKVKEACRKANSKPVKCIETGIVFASGLEASKQTGVNNTCISYACVGKQKTAGGLHWKYVEVCNDK